MIEETQSAKIIHQIVKNRRQYIYTVSTLFIDENISLSKFQDHKTRTWGFYFSLDDAKQGMHRNVDSECGYYTHCVIERFSPGIYSVANFEKWWKFNKESDILIPCEKPEHVKRLINFGIG